jgi:capsule polysaccharide export protein KpsE/RkpR
LIGTPELVHIYDELLKARAEAKAIQATMPNTSPELKSLVARIDALLLEAEDALTFRRRIAEPISP